VAGGLLAGFPSRESTGERVAGVERSEPPVHRVVRGLADQRRASVPVDPGHPYVMGRPQKPATQRNANVILSAAKDLADEGDSSLRSE